MALLLPAIIPAWNFFDVIAPSPRIEVALTDKENALHGEWREFRPRPQRVSLVTMVRRMLWNPVWNESLFLVSCAERLVQTPTHHSQDEIYRRIAADLREDPAAIADTPWLAFRLVFVSREGEDLQREVLFQAPPRRIGDIPPP